MQVQHVIKMRTVRLKIAILRCGIYLINKIAQRLRPERNDRFVQNRKTQLFGAAKFPNGRAKGNLFDVVKADCNVLRS